MTLLSVRLSATLASVAAVLALGACGGSSTAPPSSPPATSTPHSSTPTPSPSPTPAPVDPLTGGRVSTNGIIAVKIDDTENGRPQRNIDKADVVYIEEAEGGLTRLLAVFHSSLPSVEAVRSVRAADPEILAQYGPIAFVASGGASAPLAVLDRSPLKTAIGDRGADGISRDDSRYAPYNEVADLAAIAARLKAPKAKSVGFEWSASTAGLAGTPSSTRFTVAVGGTQVEFRYDATTQRYNRYIDGVLQHAADGAVVSAANVIVQFCRVEVYPADVDVNGNPNKYTYTVGNGSVAVFRQGHEILGTWTRAAAASPTTFRTRAGAPIELQPGNVWVVLTQNGNRIG